MAYSLAAVLSLRARTLTVGRDLHWDAERATETPWLSSYAEVPDNARPPLAMTPPHPEAVGSYGPALIAWAREAQGIRVRWWQGLAICRILEHRADGSLCWEEVVLSCSRRSGKSVIVRLLALWRLVFAPALFGEMQLIVHSANTLRVAKEPMRYASRWAQAQGHLKVSTNNNNYAIEDTDGGHRWIVLPPENTAGLDTCFGILDEAWATKPEVVDDDLEPSLLERVSPQLLLVSTAHRRTTSLMRGRIAGALAGEGSDRALLLLWAALPDEDPSNPETWRSASPHWTRERERYLARKYDKAARGENDPEFDDPDPMEGFKAQYLNQWPKTIVRGGEEVVTRAEWEGLEEPAADDDSTLVAVAVESWFAEGVCVATAHLRADGRVTVGAREFPSLPEAAAYVEELKPPAILAGKSLANDHLLAGCEAVGGTSRQAMLDLRRLLDDKSVVHDGSKVLAVQVLGMRSSRGADGARLVSNGRMDAVKAAVWAAWRARAIGEGPKIY